MITYYSAIILLSILALGVLSILVHENGRIQKTDKRQFYLTYLLIALSALSEWTGIQLDGRENLPKWPLLIAKCMDYILTPLAGWAMAGQMKFRNRWNRVLRWILSGNIALQIVSCFFGWMVIIDEHNHYRHGPLYFIYVIVYIAVILLVIIEFFLYGKTFRRQNRFSLYTILGLILCGIGLQEILGEECRTAYISLVLASAMLFIHDTEFSQMSADEHIQEQWIRISTDALTGMLSRYSYAEALRSYNEQQKLPEDLSVFSIDVNGLKAVNDTLGHTAGDELIRGAGRCIEKVFGAFGRCCRTGGDEFVVLANMSRRQAEDALVRLKQEAASWSGEAAKELFLAAGFARAADHPGLSAEKLVIEADKAMYAAKSKYYQETGKDRRKR